MTRDVCPARMVRCKSPEVCWLIFCARSRLSLGRMRPIDEREMTAPDRYKMLIAEQKSGSPAA